MRLILFQLFSCLAFFAEAQNTDPLPWLVNRHCYFARYAEAQTAVDKALQSRSNRPESKEYAVALSMAGYMDWVYARYGKADTALTTAAAIFERIQTTADSNYLKNLSWQVGVCRDLGQYGRAKEIIQKGLAASERCQNTPHGAFKAGMLEQYAGYNEGWCHFSDAKLQYQRLIEVQEKQYGKKHVKWAIAITQYAIFLNEKLSDFTEAESLLLKAKKILEPLTAKYPKEYVNVLSGLSDLYGYGIPRHQVSQQLLDEAIAFVKQYLGELHPVYAGLLRTLASNYTYRTPLFYKADTLNRQALAIYTYHFGELYPYRIGAMQDIASWYGQLGRNKDATQQRKEAYTLCLRILGENHISTASLMLSVASDLQNEGKRLEADTLIDKALAIYKTKVGTIHTGYINALEAKSGLWKWQGRLGQADSLLLDIQRRQGELFGRNSPEWFNSMNELSSFDLFYAKRLKCDSLIRLSEVYYRKKGWEHTATFWNLLNTKIYFLRYEKRYSEAKLVADELSRLVETTFGKENFWYLTALRSQIDIKSKLKDFETVKKLLAEYEKISLKIYGHVSGSRLNYLDELENFYQLTKSESDILTLQEEKMELEEKLGGSGSLYCMNLCQLANSYSTFGRYEESRKIIEKAKDFAKSAFGDMDDDYLYILWALEQAYFNLEDYDAAFSTMLDFKKVLLRLKVFDGDYKKAYLMNIGRIENERGNYQEAEKYFKEWGTMESTLSDYGYYNLYGGLLCDMNRYAESDSMYKIGLAIQEKAQDDRDFFYNNMAINQMKWGNYPLELEYAEMSLKESRRRLGENNPKFATNIGNYATALCNMDQLVEAEGYYLEAMNLIEKTKGRDNADFALKLNNYGVFLWQVGRMQEAKEALQESLNIYATKTDPELPDRYTTLGNLKHYYQDIGQLKEAEELSHQIIAYWKERAPKSADYGAALNGYGQFCRSIGENEKAVAIFSEMKDIYAHIFDANSPRVAEALAQIGRTQISAKQYDAAIQTYQQCRVLDSLNVGTEHSLYSFDLHSLGNCYFLQGNYPQAEKYLLRSNQIKAKIFNSPVKAIGETYNILAAVYEAQNRLHEAETACRKAIDVLLAAVGEKNEDYLEARQRLGNILAAQHREVEAKVELLASYEGYRSKIRGAFSYFSTVQQQSLIAKYNLLEFCPTFQTNAPPAFWGGIAYDNALLLKGVALQNSRTLREKLASDSSLVEPYKDWLDALNNIYAQYRLRIGERDNLDSLQQIADGLEKQLAQRSSDYKSYLQSFDTRWQDVQQKLKPNGTAIEFIRFNRKKAGGPDDFWYAALVLRADGKEPPFVPLCAEVDLPKILQDNQKRDPDAVAGIYNIPVGTTRGGGGARPVQESLYVNIWQPVEKWLDGATRVYFSPDGLLHRVNFGALGFNDAQGREVRLLKQYTLTQLGSTRELAAIEAPISTNGGQVLYAGNIDYGMPQHATKGSTRAGYSPLDKSEEKMSNTAAIFTKNNIPLQKIDGKDATEKKVLQLLSASKSPKAVLFDTHGFFLPEPIGSKADTTLAHLYWERNPMMQSGLVFANVNESLAKGREAETETDGVLTALDFAKTNLKGTEVVILPVCNSALGKIQSTEGVFGLQRAFKQAGAKYVLMSLWEVPDDAIQSFTDEFLRQWLENPQSIPEAFHATQKKKYEDRTDIRTWGAMILIE